MAGPTTLDAFAAEFVLVEADEIGLPTPVTSFFPLAPGGSSIAYTTELAVCLDNTVVFGNGQRSETAWGKTNGTSGYISTGLADIFTMVGINQRYAYGLGFDGLYVFDGQTTSLVDTVTLPSYSFSATTLSSLAVCLAANYVAVCYPDGAGNIVATLLSYGPSPSVLYSFSVAETSGAYEVSFDLEGEYFFLADGVSGTIATATSGFAQTTLPYSSGQLLPTTDGNYLLSEGLYVYDGSYPFSFIRYVDAPGPIAYPNYPLPGTAFTYQIFGQTISIVDISTGGVSTVTLTGTSGAQLSGAAISPDGQRLWVVGFSSSESGTFTYLWEVVLSGPTESLIASNFYEVYPVDVEPTITPAWTIKVVISVTPLFIPIKAVANYTASDQATDLLAIENWANTFAPPGNRLALPFIQHGNAPLNRHQLNADLLAIENWINDIVVPIIDVPMISLPRKHPSSAQDTTINWLYLENWAKSVGA